MIFISVGTQFPFDRMLKIIDEWLDEAVSINNETIEEVVAQVGNSTYKARNIKCFQYLDSRDFDRFFLKADFIISHAGMGNIIKAIDLGKQIFVLPRLEEFGEHRNNHQLDTSKRIEYLSNITVSYTNEDFKNNLSKILEFNSHNNSSISTRATELIMNLKRYLSDNLEYDMKLSNISALKICLIGTLPDTKNLGVSALLYSIMSGLYERIPNIHITVFDCGKGLRQSDIKIGKKTYKYQLCGAYNTRRYYQRESLWNIRLSSLLGGLGNHAVNVINQSNVVLDISGGDSFTDLYGSKRFYTVSIPKLITLHLNKPLILLPQTYGPFNKKKYKDIAKRIVKSATSAWARDERSFLALKELLADNYQKDLHHSGVDVAFLLPLEKPKYDLSDTIINWFTTRQKPTVGFNISGLIYNNPKSAIEQYGFRADYNKIVINFLTKLITETDANILLIPHVLEKEGSYESDPEANNVVFESIKNLAYKRLEVIPPIYNQSEIKWIISKCDWFCGTRMHSTIAALSTGVPTATIAYSSKAKGVFETCNQGEHVFDPRIHDADFIINNLFYSYKKHKLTLIDIVNDINAVKNRAKLQMDELAHLCQVL